MAQQQSKILTRIRWFYFLIWFFIFSTFSCTSTSQKSERVNDRPQEERNHVNIHSSKREKGSVSLALKGKIFPSQVAAPSGQGFYSNNSADLIQQIDGFLAEVSQNSDLQHRDILGILSPHAGYRFSGPTAAHAYSQLKGREYKTVVVIGLSHRKGAQKVALLDYDGYETPLGIIPIDKESSQELIQRNRNLIEFNSDVFRSEHSLEVQLPFLQRVLSKGFSIVPVILATRNEEHSLQSARALHELFGKRKDVCFVISSDLSHFYNSEKASRIDHGILELILTGRLEEYRNRGAQSRTMPCGYFPILTMLELFRLYDESSRRTTLLKYQNSGDTSGDRSRVVGYASVAFSLDKGIRTIKAIQNEPLKKIGESEKNGLQKQQVQDVQEAENNPNRAFTKQDKQSLLNIARQSVEAAVLGRMPNISKPHIPKLNANGAAFVTLNCKTDASRRCIGPGEGLRGCIGHVIARKPLYQCVAEVARSAAIYDRRFPPLTESELGHISYEISVLTPPRIVGNIDSIVVGRDGLIMSRNGQRGLLLPQVPVELGWSRETFLSQTCRKAGMESSCWNDSHTRIERFGALVWGEDLVVTEHHR